MPEDRNTETSFQSASKDGNRPVDRESAELIDYFLDELQRCIGVMEQAWLSGNHADLRTIAVQLKGAGSGYGYPEITEAARHVEQQLLEAQADAAALGEKIEALIQICRHAGRLSHH